MPKSNKSKKPNILVIWGDDIGISNLSCYSHGLMGYQTPNIDRLAKEGMMFTDSYGEQSCTAGRSAFITGQSVYRTGLSKVGLPGAPIGMSEKLVTIAAVLKEQGYATGQFGKNHLGDLNHMLPTNHGFDEFRRTRKDPCASCTSSVLAGGQRGPAIRLQQRPVREHVPDLRGSGSSREIRRNLQGVPTGTATELVHDRRRDGEDAGKHR